MASEPPADAETVECWHCGNQRYSFESCHHCGASCKPLTKRKQQRGEVAFDKHPEVDDA